jgi:hypothetical protein
MSGVFRSVLEEHSEEIDDRVAGVPQEHQTADAAQHPDHDDPAEDP